MAHRYLLVEVQVPDVKSEHATLPDWRDYHQLRMQLRRMRGVTQVLEIGPNLIQAVGDDGRTYASKKV